jgi:hypothetical protein
MRQKQLHALPSNTSNYSRRWVDIVFTKDGICTLVNIVIVDPTWMDLLPWTYATQGFATSNATQAKKWRYHNQHLINQFLLLTMEVFGCLHKQVDVFLHNCANAIWSLKGPKSPPLSILVIFLWQKISITLQRLQTSSILSQTIALGLGTSQLPPFPPLQDTSPISTIDLLQRPIFYMEKYGRPTTSGQFLTC